MKIINDILQGSPEWFIIRAGMPSASVFSEIVMKDGKSSKSRKKLLYKLAGERITGVVESSFDSFYTRRGKEMEPEARNLFVFLTGIDVQEVGCCIHDSDLFLCSPDGLISDNCGLEIKCPNMATHIEYLLGEKVPAEYYQQVHGSMLVTGYDSWFFMSFYPGLKPFIHQEKRDTTFCDTLEEELSTFCRELDEVVEKIKE